MKSARLKVSGMTCGHCAETVAKALRNHTGVRNATVHLDAGAAEVEFEEREVSPEQLISAIEQQGYAASFAGGGAAGGA